MLEKPERLLYSCLDFEPKIPDIIIEETEFLSRKVLKNNNGRKYWQWFGT